MPIAIAETDAAATEGSRGTVVELIFDPAMVRAIGAAAKKIDHAMIAKARRQRKRALPIGLDEGARRSRPGRGRRRAQRRGQETTGKGNACKQAARQFLSLHVTLSDEVTIDGASRAVRDCGAFHESHRRRGTSGNETVNRDPLPSSLTTSIRPL